MADFALIAPDGAFLASLGACLDAFVVVQAQMERLFPAEDGPKMETRLRLLTADGQAARLADGRRLPSDGIIGETRPFAQVHVVNFRIGSPTALTQRLAAAGPFCDWLHRQRQGGCLLSASGSAVFLLAEAGLLGGVPVPVSRALAPLCRELFPRLQIDHRRPIVEQDGLILGGGPAAEPALMVRLVERTVSAGAGRWLAAVTGVDRVAEERLAVDPLVANAQIWLELRFAQDLRIADLVRALSTSHQTLNRRFQRELGMGPKDYVQHLRVLTAQRMLARTNRPIDQIAAMVGYRDPRSFRLVFHDHAGMSPTAYRRQAAEKAGGPDGDKVRGTARP